MEQIDEMDSIGRAWEDVVRRTPSKAAMAAAGVEPFLEGWLPAAPLISGDTRVVAFGSCLAARFAEWLADHGYNRAFRSDTDESLVRNPLDAPPVVAQQFRWAFGELDPDLAFWVDESKQRFEATEEHRLGLRDTLASAELIIITLGLGPIGWTPNRASRSGAPLHGACPAASATPSRRQRLQTRSKR